MTLPVFLQNRLGKRSFKAQALLNSRATANFINYRLVRKFKMTTIPLEKELIVRNADDTENILGCVKEKVYLHMRMRSHKEVLRLFVSDLGRDDIILGHAWLKCHNPQVNWRKHSLQFPSCLPSCCLSVKEQWEFSGAPKADFLAGQRCNPRTHWKQTVHFNEPDISILKENDSISLLKHFLQPIDIGNFL
jgi:Retroviral aspartyl protease